MTADAACTVRWDLLCLGRAAVDLYSLERGASLDQAVLFRKSLGGAAGNAAVGAARLGMKVALLSRVGEDAAGRFVRDFLAAEGVDTEPVWTVPDRLTGLVLLALEGPAEFPHVFYRERCADMAVDEEQVRAVAPERASILLLTGTHLSQPEVEQASWLALQRARRAGRTVVMDLDYRPVLWGEAPVGEGAARRGVGSRARDVLLRFLPHLQVVIGTEDEFCMAGGHSEPSEAVACVRAHTSAHLVVKQGARGAWSLAEDGTVERDSGVFVPVHNALGAGDAFLAAYLWAMQNGLQELERLRYANAAGGLVAARHGCAPATPFGRELERFVQDIRELADPIAALRRAESTHERLLRERMLPVQSVNLLAMDHRRHFQDEAARCGKGPADIVRLKRLIFRGGNLAFLDAGIPVERSGYILDDEYSQDLAAEVPRGARVARAIEANQDGPLAFVDEPARAMAGWPVGHLVKCKLGFHPDEPEAVRQHQRETVARLHAACAAQDRRLLLEVIPRDPHGREDLDAVPAAVEDLARFVEPLWWKLPPPSSAAQWEALEAVLRRTAPAGVLLLGNGLPAEEVEVRLRLARTRPACRGFAFGRTVFAAAVRSWLEGRCTDRDVVESVRGRLRSLIESWSSGAT